MGRKQWDGSAFSVQSMDTERVWDTEGVPILQARASLPQPLSPDRRLRKVRSFYRLQSRAFFRYCQGELRPWAEKEYRIARENSAPLPCFHAELTFHETCRMGRLWSLYTELQENAGPGSPTRRRWGDAWDLATGYPVAISAFFPPRSHWKRKLLAIAAAEIERQEKRGLSRYYPDWRRRLRRFLNLRNYYITSDGLTFFFPMYALAPPLEGIPSFLCPWEELSPQLLCERG
ncbi:MAG: DUF3298 domain-containing protein, partial [Oscillospiraceae bacterium]|nr:DUF3298 domain-containing protein [Oscillospiraceae bacterium]